MSELSLVVFIALLFEEVLAQELAVALQTFLVMLSCNCVLVLTDLSQNPSFE